MAKQLIWEPGTTYKDWGLLPGRIKRNTNPDDVDLRTPITKYAAPAKKELDVDNLPDNVFVLNVPLLSAPMQSVTGHDMAIELAKTGGLGVIYCSQPVADEARMIAQAKKYKAGFVTPDVFSPRTPIAVIAQHSHEKGYSTFPITHNGKPDGKLLGLITRKDFSKKKHLHLTAKDRMVHLKDLVAPEEREIDGDLSRANDILEESHHGAIPIIDRGGHLKYMVFRKDIEQHRENPLELVDGKKRYKVGAAINTKDYRQRVPALIDAGADILFIDSSQGFSDYQEDAMRYLRRNFPDIPFIGGNVVTEEGFYFLVANGAWGVKIGMGPGSICTTREKFRVGRSQATAVIKIHEARMHYLEKEGIYVPLIPDGGIVTNDDIWVASALGGDAEMAGRFFARFDESPTERVELKEVRDGRTYTADVKPYWGEGSERAKRWRKKRYGQSEESEGVEGWAPYSGRLSDAKGIPRVINSIRTALHKGGYSSIQDLHRNAVLEKESQSSRAEGRPHDIGGPGVLSNYTVW